MEDDTKKATPNYAAHLRKIGGCEGPRVNNARKTAVNNYGGVISPYTNAVHIRHLRQKHPIIADMDGTRIRGGYAEILPDKPASGPFTLLTDAEDPDCFAINELGDFSCDYDDR